MLQHGMQVSDRGGRRQAATQYVRADAAKLRDNRRWSGRQPVSRLFTAVSPSSTSLAWNRPRNPFAGLYLDREQGVSARKPISVPAIKRVQASPSVLMTLCGERQLSTWYALAEVIGLQSRISTCSSYPHVDLKPHPWRRLKTKAACVKCP